MKLSSYLAAALVAASWSVGASPTSAQSISSVQAPAEFPPASYTGRQYVDSDGCVFVRAGIDGNVTWVPRVSRSRKVICGFQPSLPKAAAVADAPAQPPAKPAAKPAAQVVAQRAPTTQPVQNTAPAVAAIPAQPRVVRTTVPAALPVKPAASKPAPKPVKTVAPQQTAMAKPAAMAPRQTACRGASPLSRKYLTEGRGLTVRCGPQETPHVTVIRGGDARSVTYAANAAGQSPHGVSSYRQPVPLKRSAATTVVASHAGAPTQFNQIPTRGVYIPDGYQSVWEDGRLNPRRGHRTAAGDAQMELIWTNTLPRILVDRQSGREVAYLYPGLQYPYTSYAEQNAARAIISTRGSTPKRSAFVDMSHGRDRVLISARNNPVKATKSNRSRTVIAGVSARSSTPAVTQSAKVTTVRATPVATGARYVQAGMFANPGNAERAAQRLANAGLPARLGNVTRNGRSYGLVMAGPFSNPSHLAAALQQVRSLGFSDAFLRK